MPAPVSARNQNTDDTSSWPPSTERGGMESHAMAKGASRDLDLAQEGWITCISRGGIEEEE